MSSLTHNAPHNTQIFNFQDNQIRIKIIDGKEYFCAKDVCDVLCYSNGKDAVSRHCKTKGVVKHDTLTNGGIQQLTYIDEPNLYRLISHSKLPTAELFEAWIFETILPQLRKTGKFEVKELTKFEILTMALESEKMVLQLQNEVKERDNVIQEKTSIIDEFITISNTKNYTQVGKILHQKPRQFIEWLRDNKYIMKHREPYQKYLDMEIFVIKTPEIEGKSRKLSYHITPKGFEYFRKKLFDKTAPEELPQWNLSALQS